eukprot:403349848
MGCQKSKIQQDAVVSINKNNSSQITYQNKQNTQQPTQKPLTEQQLVDTNSNSPNLNLSNIKPILKQPSIINRPNETPQTMTDHIIYEDYRTPLNQSKKQVDFQLENKQESDVQEDIKQRNGGPANIYQPLKHQQKWLSKPMYSQQQQQQNHQQITNDDREQTAYMDSALEQELIKIQQRKNYVKPPRQYLKFQYEDEGEFASLYNTNNTTANNIDLSKYNQLRSPNKVQLNSRDVLISQMKWRRQRDKTFLFSIQKQAIVPLQKYKQIFTDDTIINQSTFKSEIPLKFQVNSDGQFISAINMKEVVDSQIDQKLRENMSKYDIDQLIDKETQSLKRLWASLVSKWVNMPKDDFTIKSKYSIDFGDYDVFEMEYIKDENPNLIKQRIRDQLMGEDFYQKAVYQTVRRNVGKGIWMADYKKSLKDDDKIGVDSQSEEDSRELLKKELQFVDNMKTLKKINGNSNQKDKKQLKLAQSLSQSLDTITFNLTNSTDTYRTHVFEDNLKTLKTLIKHQNLIVYSHRNQEYLTVDVEGENSLIYFMYEGCQEYLETYFMRDCLEFLVESEKEQADVKSLLENSQVPFNE